MKPDKNSLILGYWLLICALFVYLMIIVGGVTRLTQSGLSMVEWSPIMGVLPPIGDTAWLEVFEKYKQFPEYQQVNVGMSLEAFKSIFWWEYGHRVLGRIIGLVYLLPLLLFITRGMVPKHWRLRLFFLFILGGIQGVMGWYMVKSGLVDVPHVSQYRLTAHLGLAIVIFACMFWFAMDFLRGETARPVAQIDGFYNRVTVFVVFIVFIMMLSGGFVAGTKAGYVMNTFPKMNGEWVPNSLMALTPWWRNLFENVVTIQFTHRCIAVIVLLSLLTLFVSSLKQQFKTCAWLALVVVCIQVLLGVSALVMRVPVTIGAAHQAGAVALLAVCLLVAHIARNVRNSA